jgi:regulator of protease activity HflC (stomatin/prohibitin superfamily)
MEALEGLLVTVVVALGFVLTLVAKSIRIVNEYERGVVFRLGRVDPATSAVPASACSFLSSTGCTRSIFGW